MTLNALDLPMGSNDAKAKTVRGYLIALLSAIWSEEEGFSGKRPFGNSGWQTDLYYPLVKAGIVNGTLGEGEWIDDISSDERKKADGIIAAAIKTLGTTRKESS